jgi:hypothetical protein
MGSNKAAQYTPSIANFEALKTSITNDEEQLVKELLVKELLANQTMQNLEKNYLIDIAKHHNNIAIIKLLEDIPLTK